MLKADEARHPTPRQLAAYALGKLDAPGTATVDRHVSDCETCRNYLTDTPRDSLIAELRRGRPASEQSTPGVKVGDTQSTPKRSDPSPGAARPNSLISGLAPADVPETPLAPLVIPQQLREQTKYEILRLLGSGGMGSVYLAHHKRMDRQVAIKVINRAMVDHPQALDRFDQEIRAAAKLDHPNVARAYDADEIGSLRVLILEFVPGRTLDSLLSVRGTLTIREACQCVMQALVGLQHAHERGMIHRDLKPQNLMITPEGGIKILDFGLAKIASEQMTSPGLTRDNSSMGTPHYLAPEQFKDAARADIRADIYSLGCTLYELLSGAPPFDGKSGAIIDAHLTKQARPLIELRPETPAALSALVARMLAKEPADRPQTPLEVVRELQAIEKAFAASAAARAAHLPSVIVAPATKPESRPSRWANLFANRRRVAIAGAILGAAALFALLAGVLAVRTKYGTIIVENALPGAEVLVDGDTVTLSRDGEALLVSAVPAGAHHIKIVRNGQELWSDDVSVEFAGQQVRVRYEAYDAGHGSEHSRVESTSKGAQTTGPAQDPKRTDNQEEIKAGKELLRQALLQREWIYEDNLYPGRKGEKPPITTFLADGRFGYEFRWYYWVIDRTTMHIQFWDSAYKPATAVVFKFNDDLTHGSAAFVDDGKNKHYLTLTSDLPVSAATLARDVLTPKSSSPESVEKDNVAESDVDDDDDDESRPATAPPSEKGPNAIATVAKEKVTSPRGKPINLIASIDLARHVFKGKAEKVGDALVLENSTQVAIPWTPQGGFEIRMTVERLEGNGGFAIGAALGGMPFEAEFDAVPTHGFYSGLWISPSALEALPVRGQQFAPNQPQTIVCRAQGDELLLSLAGRVIDRKPLKERPRVRPNDNNVPPEYAFYLKAAGIKIRVTDAVLIPLDGEAIGDSEVEVKAKAAQPATRKASDEGANQFARVEDKAFFNQRDLAGWNGLASHWRVERGEIVGAQPDAEREHTFLCSQRTYKDFELSFSVRLQGDVGNSGVQIRSPAPDMTTYKMSGPQVDIAPGEPQYPTGSIVTEPRAQPAITSSLDEVAKVWQVGEFNLMTIRCEGRHVTTKINGVTVVDADFETMPEEGYIAWQLHGGRSPDEIRFKNIRLVELKEPDAASASETGTATIATVEKNGWQSGGEGFVELFNGRDLTGWKTLAQQPNYWSVADGVLVGQEPTSSFLFTEQGDFEDVHVRAEIRINAAGNSGVCFRSPFGPVNPNLRPTFEVGYEAQVCPIGQTNGNLKTGAFYRRNELAVAQTESLARSDDWFVIEIIAQGNEFGVLVDGKEAAHYVDPDRHYTKGHIALQMRDASTMVQVRHIEAKRL